MPEKNCGVKVSLGFPRSDLLNAHRVLIIVLHIVYTGY